MNSWFSGGAEIEARGADLGACIIGRGTSASHSFSRVAQRKSNGYLKPGVGGSSPSSGTIYAASVAQRLESTSLAERLGGEVGGSNPSGRATIPFPSFDVSRQPARRFAGGGPGSARYWTQTRGLERSRGI